MEALMAAFCQLLPEIEAFYERMTLS